MLKSNELLKKVSLISDQISCKIPGGSSHLENNKLRLYLPHYIAKSIGISLEFTCT